MIIFTKLLLYLGLLLLLGGCLVRRFLLPCFPPRRWLAAGLLALLIGASLSAWWPLYQFGYTRWEDILEYLTGVTAGRAAVSVVMGACVLLAAELSGLSVLALFGAGFVTLWGIAGLGHGAAHGEQIRALHTFHALAMTIWLGGLLSLLLVPSSKLSAIDKLANWRIFSPVAATCAALSVFTGFIMSFNHGGNPLQWLSGNYGRLLILKIVLVSLALLLAFFVRKNLHNNKYCRRLQTRQTSRLKTMNQTDDIHADYITRDINKIIWLECVIMLLIVLLTAILGQTPSLAHPL